jgi:hypothetical protein
MITFNIKVRDVETGKVTTWTLNEVLEEINRDRSEDWTDYDASDWREGWRDWVQDDGYFELIEKGETND